MLLNCEVSDKQAVFVNLMLVISKMKTWLIIVTSNGRAKFDGT